MQTDNLPLCWAWLQLRMDQNSLAALLEETKEAMAQQVWPSINNCAVMHALNAIARPCHALMTFSALCG